MIDIALLVILFVLIIGITIYLYQYNKSLNEWIEVERNNLRKKENLFREAYKSVIINK